MKIFIRISFYGANFFGTQKQKKGTTIQGEFESLLSRIYAEPIKVTISSRLDKDVNALDFALVYTAPHENISLDHLKYYLERGSGEDIHIKDVRVVADTFNPRYDCAYKEYLYLIQNREESNPLLNPISFAPKYRLDENKIKAALMLFQGRHDFRSFATPEGEENTILDLDEVSFTNKDDILYLRFKSKAFLRYQIRFMVGACVSYAMGKLTLEQIESMLNGNYVKYVKFKVPGKGLTLEHIYFPDVDESEAKGHYASILF